MVTKNMSRMCEGKDQITTIYSALLGMISVSELFSVMHVEPQSYIYIQGYIYGEKGLKIISPAVGLKEKGGILHIKGLFGF